jgi:hypothetical protein
MLILVYKFLIAIPMPACISPLGATSEQPLLPMQARFCDIAQGPVMISGPSMECNGTSGPAADRIVVFGQSQTNGILIRNANITVQLQYFGVTADSPFLCDGASVAIILEGSTSLSSSSSESSGLGCSHESNISITGIDEGQLSGIGGSSGAGIGPGQSSQCDSISTFGSSVGRSSGSNGAGGGTGESSSLDQLSFSNSTVTASCGTFGAAIGAGSSSSSVGTLAFFNATVSATPGWVGAGIGAGYSRSSVGNVVIVASTATARGTDKGSGIGGGSYSSPVGLKCSAGPEL